jgi:hypothetical protein
MADLVRLRRVKLLHTLIWAVLASCVVALFWVGWHRRFGWALAITVTILSECVVLAFNQGRCPLTEVAARYTEDRADNFDIYLPIWLARYNKHVFGLLFLAGETVVAWRWLTSVAS